MVVTLWPVPADKQVAQVGVSKHGPEGSQALLERLFAVGDEE
jgi:hypothetical protein